MKRTKYFACTLALLLLCQGCGTAHSPDEPDAVSSYSFNRDITLTVVANRDEIEDMEAFAEKLLSMCKENSFHTIKFSNDAGYPTSLTMRVYYWEDEIEGNAPAFVIDYKPKEYGHDYNIIDNPDEYEMTIDDNPT